MPIVREGRDLVSGDRNPEGSGRPAPASGGGKRHFVPLSRGSRSRCCTRGAG